MLLPRMSDNGLMTNVIISIDINEEDNHKSWDAIGWVPKKPGKSYGNYNYLCLVNSEVFDG